MGIGNGLKPIGMPIGMPIGRPIGGGVGRGGNEYLRLDIV